MSNLLPIDDQLETRLAAFSPEVQQAIWAVRNSGNAVDFAEAERRVHEALRRQADEVVGLALQARLQDRDFVELGRAEAHAQAHAAGMQLRSKGDRPTSVRLLGGTTLPIRTLLLLPATPKASDAPRKRGQRGASGAGVYPALAKLGIAERATPALREAVARQVAASTSVKAARQALERQGIRIDHKAALRLTYAFAEQALAARDAAIGAPEAAMDEVGSAGPMAGRRLVVSLDGGRLRIKAPHPDPDADDDRRFEPQWREPKVLTIYALDERGRRDPKLPALIDATMGDADQVSALLVGHLRLLGAHHAEHVQFIADGGSWIWARTEAIRQAAGIERARWSEQLDLPHTVAYLARLIEPLADSVIDRQTWLMEQKTSLLHGDVDEVIAVVQALHDDHGLDVEAAIAFLHKHRARLCFLFCRADGQPMGSGAVESAIRRVVNLRLKGNSIFWLVEHAEAILHLRSQLVTDRWPEMVTRTLLRPVWSPRQAA